MSVGDVCKIHLESIAPGGNALGRIEGKPVFVEGGAPDETVLCRITEDRNTWARAVILEIIEPSAVRSSFYCAFYTQCGGCNLAHIDYKTQLDIKASILGESFLRFGGFEPPKIECFQSQPFEYRNRMQFHCLRQKANGNNYGFGLKGRGTREIVQITDCPVAVPKIREILKSPNHITLPVEKDRFTVFSKDNILLNEGAQAKGKIKLLDKEITADAGLFFQSNCSMLEVLILELRKIIEDTNTYAINRALPMADLYCGVGTFALFLGSLFPKVILAEENKSSVSLARENLRGINAEFFALRDSEWQKTLLRSAGMFDFAVIDPPRAGLNGKLAYSLAERGPSVLAYVSCDAAALARDSKILICGGYKLKELKLFDFYPQTAHIESLALFAKN
jgi:23S rRNA (uracil1939-C5)-methyltransferase